MSGNEFFGFPSMAYAQSSGCSKSCDALGGFADQDAVGRRSGAGADAEQGIEGGMPCPAPIEAEHELVEVVVQAGFAESVVDAQAPPRAVGKQPGDPGQC